MLQSIGAANSQTDLVTEQQLFQIFKLLKGYYYILYSLNLNDIFLVKFKFASRVKLKHSNPYNI